MKNNTTITESFLSKEFGRYKQGGKVLLHRIEFFQGKYYVLAEMKDGELRTLDVEYLTTGGELEKERRRQIEALKQRPDLVDEERIEGAAEGIAREIRGKD